MKSSQAIGVFDSGIGGLTVVRHLQEQLPHEDIIYLGDTARVPYGIKSEDVIQEFSLQDSQFLINKDVKCIVIACNTASAHAYDLIKKTYPNIPVFGMIDSGSQYAMKKSRNKQIGIIGTSATIQSRLYEKKLKDLSEQIETLSADCPLFVPIVEENLFSGPITDQIIDMYLNKFKTSSIDTLILGCTHYPMLKQAIQNYLGEDVYLVDSGKAAAEYVKDHLYDLDLLNQQESDGFLHCFLTCKTPKFEKIADYCLSRDVHHLEHIEIESVHI